MSTAIFKIALFSMVFNISIYIMALLLPGMAGNMGGLTYDSSMTQSYVVGLNGSLQTSTIAETTATDYFMDSISVNSIVKFISAIPKSMYSLPNYFASSVAPHMDPFTGGVITFMIYSILSILYALGIITLFISKPLLSGD